MSRLLAPCGTPAAYQRHRRADEPACDACKAAHTAAIVKLKNRPRDEPRPSQARGTYKGGRNLTATEMDRLLEQHPPEIVWEKNSYGVWYAVVVHDPYMERPVAQQAVEVADFRKRRADNTPLMTAARTAI